METLTIKQIITTAYEHIKHMKRPAIDGNYGRYICENGERCPIGALLPLELLTDNMNQYNISVLFQNYSKIQKLVGENLSLWVQIQKIHDRNVSNVPQWKENMLGEMEQLATKYNIELV